MKIPHRLLAIPMVITIAALAACGSASQQAAAPTSTQTSSPDQTRDTYLRVVNDMPKSPRCECVVVRLGSGVLNPKILHPETIWPGQSIDKRDSANLGEDVVGSVTYKNGDEVEFVADNPTWSSLFFRFGENGEKIEIDPGQSKTVIEKGHKFTVVHDKDTSDTRDWTLHVQS